jgi:hypothetical protein
VALASRSLGRRRTVGVTWLITLPITAVLAALAFELWRWLT